MDRINELISICRKSENSESVSDIHIQQDEHPSLRVDGDLKVYKRVQPFRDSEIEQFINAVYEENGESQIHLKEHGYVTLSIHNEHFGDVRVHVQRRGSNKDLIIRLLNPEVPEFSRLNLPAKILEFADFPSGLVLFTGATGSGKSTALAALVNEINKKHTYSIYTIEDPIEYRHTSRRSLVKQLNVGSDVQSYKDGLRSLLRADPDVILIGEMRDTETIRAAMQAAETGHLVFSTMHDNSAADTVSRIINSFPGDEQKQASATFISVIRAIVSLKLVPKKGQSGGRIPAAEILIANDAIRSVIQNEKFLEISGLIDGGQQSGMKTLERSLNELVSRGEISKETAQEYANKPDRIK